MLSYLRKINKNIYVYKVSGSRPRKASSRHNVRDQAI